MGLLLLGSIFAAPQKTGAAQLQLSWVDVSNNEDGFKIERSGGGKSKKKSKKAKFKQIATPGANVTTYTDTSVQMGATYCYRVRAYNRAGNSAYSNPACALVPMNVVAPAGVAGAAAQTAAAKTVSTGALANAAPSAAAPLGLPASIGVFRPSTGEWFLDRSGKGVFDGCKADACVGPLGGEGDIPVAGSWNGGEPTLLGFFDPADASWYLDLNGNGVLDGCEAGSCRFVYGAPGDLPVVGDWTGSGKSGVGIFRPQTGEWYLDLDGSGDLDGCDVDACYKLFGGSGDLPVVGDWSGGGKSAIGIFRPQTGEWLLDLGGEGVAENCATACLAFGQAGDLPVVGDWTGDGADKIGVFRPGTGEWFLDLNGNGQWDGCNVDLCLGPFGQPGDLPVVGKWM